MKEHASVCSSQCGEAECPGSKCRFCEWQTDGPLAALAGPSAGLQGALQACGMTTTSGQGAAGDQVASGGSTTAGAHRKELSRSPWATAALGETAAQPPAEPLVAPRPLTSVVFLPPANMSAAAVEHGLDTAGDEVNGPALPTGRWRLTGQGRVDLGGSLLADQPPQACEAPAALAKEGGEEAAYNNGASEAPPGYELC